MTWSPDGRHIVLGNRVDKILWIDVEEQTVIRRETMPCEVSLLPLIPPPSQAYVPRRIDKRSCILKQWLTAIDGRRRSFELEHIPSERAVTYDQSSFGAHYARRFGFEREVSDRR